MKYVTWLLKAVIFFVLFAFALNNQEAVDLNLFFGTTWQAPLVLVVLASFVLGLFAGIAVMLPLWWSAKKVALPQGTTPSPKPPTASARHGA